MIVDANTLKEWLSDLKKDRHWLAGEIGVSKRTLDNWFSEGFPPYAVKSIERLRNEMESKAPDVSESCINLTIAQWKELTRRAKESGFDDELEYINAVLKKSLE